MKQNEIIEMARQAGLHVATDVNWMPIIGLEYAEKLIALARADEREACAKLVEGLPAPDIYSDTDKSMWDVTCIDCADAIRVRGEQA
jgi:hypothetical protein